MSELESFLQQYTNEIVSVAFSDLESGAEFCHREAVPLHPASTFKVAVMMECFHQADQGLLSLNDPVPVKNAFASLADGSIFSTNPDDDAEPTLYGKVGGSEQIRELVRLVIVRSSNLATNILVQIVRAPAIMEYLGQLGVEGVRVLRGVEDYKAYDAGLTNSATAQGLMQLMRAIADGRAGSHQSVREMTEILLAQEFNEGIPAGLPASARVAHKTGWVDRIYHDFGIVFPHGRGPYVLAVMTSGFEDEKEAHTCVAQVSHLIHKQLSL